MGMKYIEALREGSDFTMLVILKLSNWIELNSIWFLYHQFTIYVSRRFNNSIYLKSIQSKHATDLKLIAHILFLSLFKNKLCSQIQVVVPLAQMFSDCTEELILQQSLLSIMNRVDCHNEMW